MIVHIKDRSHKIMQHIFNGPLGESVSPTLFRLVRAATPYPGFHQSSRRCSPCHTSHASLQCWPCEKGLRRLLGVMCLMECSNALNQSDCLSTASCAPLHRSKYLYSVCCVPFLTSVSRSGSLQSSVHSIYRATRAATCCGTASRGFD